LFSVLNENSNLSSIVKMIVLALKIHLPTFRKQ